MRYSVLQCIGQLACTGTRYSVWKGITDKVAEAVAMYLDNAQTSAVREAAAQVSATWVSAVTRLVGPWPDT